MSAKLSKITKWPDKLFFSCTALKTAKCICHVSPLYKELFWKETEKPQLIIAGSKILQESIKVSRVNDSRISIPL